MVEKIKKMSQETGISVLDIKKALKISLFPEIKIINTDMALKLLAECEEYEYFCSEIVKSWEVVALEEVEKEDDFSRLNDLYKKLPPKFKASSLAVKKMQKILVKRCIKTKNIVELINILESSNPKWASHKVILKKIQLAFDDLVSKAESISELREIKLKNINFPGSMKKLLEKWNNFSLKALMDAKTINDYLEVYYNSCHDLESKCFALDNLKEVIIKELNNPERTALELEELMKKIPLKADLGHLFRKKISNLVIEEIKETQSLSRLVEIKKHYHDFFSIVTKADEKICSVTEKYLQEPVYQDRLIEVYNCAAEKKTKEIAIKKLAHFYLV